MAIDAQKQKNIDYQSQLANYNSQEQSYQVALAKYNNEMRQYISDHHANGSLHWTNGGYTNINVNYDITWHWDSGRNKIVVTGVNTKINRADPEKRGGGYWDAWVYAAPGTSIPTFTGTFGGKDGDVPGVTGEKIWNSVSGIDGVYAFITQNNKTEETLIRYKDNTGKSYDAQYDGNGKWTLLAETSRWNRPASDLNSWISTWYEWGPAVQLTLPVPPTPPTTTKPEPQKTSVNYHYDTVTAIPTKIPVIPIVPRFLHNGMSN